MNSSPLKHPATLICALLMLATAVSWWLGTDSFSTGSSVAGITAALMVIAFVKVHFVIRYFMEVRLAPLALRLACGGWVVLVCAAILVVVWVSPDAASLP
jgi:multisubunit Na+/H+ antiporter MnhE subunit